MKYVEKLDEDLIANVIRYHYVWSTHVARTHSFRDMSKKSIQTNGTLKKVKSQHCVTNISLYTFSFNGHLLYLFNSIILSHGNQLTY